MAEGDVTIYNSAKQKLGDGSIDWDTDTIKCGLVGGYTPNIDTHTAWSDVSASEIAAANYTAGGVTVTASVSVNTASDRAEYDSSDPAWTSLGSATISHAIWYKDSGVAATSWLVAYMEITTNSNGGNYTINVNATGLFTLT